MPIPGVARLIGLGINVTLAYIIVAVVFAIIVCPFRWIGKLLDYIIEKCEKNKVLSILPGLVLFIILAMLFYKLLGYIVG